MNSQYWLRQAELCFIWHEYEPDMRWEKFGYFYLFRSLGYDGGF
jgi:hypothetical protein